MNQTVGVSMEDAFRMVALQLWSKQIGVEEGVRKIMSFVKAAPGPLIPLAKWDKHYDSPAVGTMRRYWYERKDRGLEDCFKQGKVGGTIFVDPVAFWAKKRS